MTKTPMKLITIYFLINLFTAKSFAQINPLLKTSAQEMNLKGKVRFIKDTVHPFGSGWGEDKESDLLTVRSMQFDFYGNKIRENEFDNTGKSLSSKTYVYSGPGLVTEMALYNSKFKLESKEIMEYDKNGFEIKWKRINKAGKITDQITKAYSFKDRLSYYYLTTDKNGKTSDSTIVFLNPNNTIKSLTKFTNGKKQAKEDYTYYRNSTIPREIKSESNDETYLYKYSEAGNLIIDELVGEPAQKIVNTYHKFDKVGNWVKKSTYPNDETKRTITYFK